MPDGKLNITPEPQVLMALTNTPLSPLDAICELVDNGIDSFRAAAIEGTPVKSPWIQVEVPGLAEIRNGGGFIRISDNGVGLDAEGLSRALTAGFSSKNAFDTLGLFGMGFNIATGKLGMRTVVTTMRRGDDFAIQTVLDLPELVRRRSFDLELIRVEKPSGLESGTVIEISDWWPEGQQNAGFVQKLAAESKPALARQLGRRYASILRRTDADRIQMRLNEHAVRGFEHCVWDETRFVERQGWGRIPAKITFDEILHTQRHCIADRTLIGDAEDCCGQCGGVDFKSIQERVRGWVGVQRFDDTDKFGIDVIRNGRTILVSEKDAFFSLVDDLGAKTREYPSDGIYGRLVGEVHLDHVPVDFTKQNFQQASDSWNRAMKFLRGESLLESRWSGEYKNRTPVGLLFKGYRKVRKPGREDMYMGRYDESQRKAVRIGRDVERDYYERFLAGEEGFYDDSKWWELVEDASRPPVRGLVPCSSCGFQNADDDETCADCGELLQSKNCISCAVEIKPSATVCEHCGTSQVPEVVSPWNCAICLDLNSVEDENCANCNSIRGALSPLSEDELMRRAKEMDELRVESRPFELAPGVYSQPLEIRVYEVPPESLVPLWGLESMPMFALKSFGQIRLFFDPDHPIFVSYKVPYVSLAAAEVAQYLLALSPDVSGKPGSNLTALAFRVLNESWNDLFVEVDRSINSEIRDLFLQFSELLADAPEAVDFFNELTNEEQEFLTRGLISSGQLEDLDALKSSGRFLSYLSPTTLSRFYGQYPEIWFTLVWDEQLPSSAKANNQAISEARNRTIKSYQRALDDCAQFVDFASADVLEVLRVSSSVKFLSEHTR